MALQSIFHKAIRYKTRLKSKTSKDSSDTNSKAALVQGTLLQANIEKSFFWNFNRIFVLSVREHWAPDQN